MLICSKKRALAPFDNVSLWIISQFLLSFLSLEAFQFHSFLSSHFLPTRKLSTEQNELQIQIKLLSQVGGSKAENGRNKAVT